MTTAKKLFLGFGILTALLIIFSVALTLRVRSIESSIENQSGVLGPRALATRLMEVNTVGFALAVRTYHQNGDSEFKKQAAERVENVETNLLEYERMAVTSRHRELAEGFKIRWQPLKILGIRLLDGPTQPVLDDWKAFHKLRLELERFVGTEMQLDARGTYLAAVDATISDIKAIRFSSMIMLIAFVIGSAMIGAIVGQNILRTERTEFENRELLAVTLDSIGDAVMATDHEGNVTFLNRQAQDLTGWTQPEAVTRRSHDVFRIVDETTREEVESPVDKVLRDRVVSGLANHTLLIAKDGEEIAIDDSGAPIWDRSGNLKGVVLVFRDITERRLTEKALRASEKQLRQKSQIFDLTLSSITDFAYTFDREGRFTYMNQALLNLWGLTLEEAVGKTFHELDYPPELAAKLHAQILEVFETGRTIRDETPYTGPSGELGYYEYIFNAVRGVDGTVEVVAGSTRDISQLRLVQEELEIRVAERTGELDDANVRLIAENAERLRIEKERVSLLKRIVTTQGDERRRIARDLHDELGQLLTALRLKLKNTRAICNEKPVLGEIDGIQRLAEQLDAEVSFLARELRPATLEEKGLALTLSSYVKEWAKFSSVLAEFHSSGLRGVRFKAEAETNIYRIAQEALNNIRKHSKAKNASVLLEKRKDEIALIVEDDGVAFDANARRSRSKGLGLIGMEERAALLGGSLVVESSAETGTTIFVRIPVSNAVDTEDSNGR